METEQKTKVCNVCKIKKNVKEFNEKKHQNGNIGLRHECKKCKAKKDKFYRHTNIEKQMLGSAKRRAIQKRLEFNITLEDIQLPEYCEVFKTKLQITEGLKTAGPNSYSLDRIDNDRGYVKGNIRVISHRANKAKSDLTDEEIEMLYEDMIKRRSLKNS